MTERHSPTQRHRGLIVDVPNFGSSMSSSCMLKLAASAIFNLSARVLPGTENFATRMPAFKQPSAACATLLHLLIEPSGISLYCACLLSDPGFSIANHIFALVWLGRLWTPPPCGSRELNRLSAFTIFGVVKFIGRHLPSAMADCQVAESACEIVFRLEKYDQLCSLLSLLHLTESMTLLHSAPYCYVCSPLTSM